MSAAFHPASPVSVYKEVSLVHQVHHCSFPKLPVPESPPEAEGMGKCRRHATSETCSPSPWHAGILDKKGRFRLCQEKEWAQTFSLFSKDVVPTSVCTHTSHKPHFCLASELRVHPIFRLSQLKITTMTLIRKRRHPSYKSKSMPFKFRYL